MKTLKVEKREFVAECLFGCRCRNKDGVDSGPLLLDQYELSAHDDIHLSSKARVLVRMLRETSLEVRRDVLEYFNKSGVELKPVYSKLIGEKNG